jgi:hypothetical protein
MKVIFDYSKKEAKENEILIGLGKCKKCINKTPNYPSCSLFLFFNPLKYNGEIIYIEDFSPDTIIPIYMLLYGEIPKKYIDYATQWEIGNSDNNLFKSYGVLQNSLVNLLEGDTTFKVKKSLEMLDFFVKNNYDLDNIPKNDNYLYLQSLDYLNNEIKKFNKILKQSEIYNLYIDNTTIKAIFLNNVNITPIIKLILRKEFDLIASFNEKFKGSGNDVVISVKPESGLNLKELWENLEKEETKKWNGKRPNDSPRKIVSTNQWNEPWWDDMGKYTLIAAPKKIGDEFGSKLSYSEIKEIILKTYRERK